MAACGRGPRALSIFALATALLVFARAARADARADARRHFRAGMALIGQGQHEPGIAELERAYKLMPHPDVLFNIGRAWADAGNQPMALQAFRRYLADDPPDADEVRRLVAELQGERAPKPTEPASHATAAPAAPAPSVAPGPAGSPAPTVASDAAVTAAPAAAGPGAAARLAIGVRDEGALQDHVETASRRDQDRLDAPNATSVVTADDIRLSGLTRLQEILRRLPGVDVNVLTGGATELSVRGFNSRLSNKVLVFVDYRPLYIDTLGATFWETSPIDVEQIERVEVVRGPGAALYGANAFSGVINIITKRPGEARSGGRAGVGTRGELFGSVTVSERVGRSAYRLSAGYTREPSWSREVAPGRVDLESSGPPDRPALDVLRFDAHSTHALTPGLVLAAGGGYTKYDRLTHGIGVFNAYRIAGAGGSADASLSSRHFALRTFYQRNDVDGGLAHNYLGLGLASSRILIDVADVQPEASGEVVTGSVPHTLRAGFNYRYKRVSWNYLDRRRTEHWVGAFVQDEAAFGPHARTIIGVRADYVPAVERVAASPRGSFIVKPTPRSALRLTAATAFRSPSFLEAYFAGVGPVPGATGAEARGVAARNIAGSSPPTYERLVSADVSYLNQDLEPLQLELTVFHQQASGLISPIARRPETPSSDRANGLNPDTGRYTVGVSTLDNGCTTYRLTGVEAEARVFPREGLDLFVNYTLNVPIYSQPAACPDVVDQRVSRQKVNVGMQVRTAVGVDGEVTALHSSSQAWSEGSAGTDVANGVIPAPLPIAAFTLLNARLGYRFQSDHAEVSAVGFNLLNARHRQHPFGEVVGRQLMAFLSYRF